MMFRGHNSSNSESEDDDFDGKFFKKVDYQGNLSDSDHEDSQMDDSNSESSKNKEGIERKMTAIKSSEPKEKSKTIKKNCESAKMSRQRKKVYLQCLEHKAHALMADIAGRKVTVRKMSERILHKFSQSNRDKYKFLQKKLALSKQLLEMSEEMQRIKRESETVQRQTINLFHNGSASPENYEGANGCLGRQQNTKGKTKKKKCQETPQPHTKIDYEAELVEKQKNLELGINAYMYEFGVKGCLRSDVIERSKFEWFQILQKSNIQQYEELFRHLKNMKNCLQRLESKSKKLDFYLRELKDRVKHKYVVQFLLDREFFIHNSTETIYKNTMMTVHEESNSGES